LRKGKEREKVKVKGEWESIRKAFRRWSSASLGRVVWGGVGGGIKEVLQGILSFFLHSSPTLHGSI